MNALRFGIAHPPPPPLCPRMEFIRERIAGRPDHPVLRDGAVWTPGPWTAFSLGRF